MLQKIQAENFNRIIKDQEKYDFNIDADDVYLILFSARGKNWLQNFRRLFNDDDLALQIDDYLFAEIKGKKREFSSVGSWNGNELKNKIKDIFIILPLKKGVHTIKLWAGEQPFLEKIEIYKIDITGSRGIDILRPDIEKFNGFMDVIIKNLAIEELTIKAKADEDSKLELRIDGDVQLNQKYKRYKKWYWYGKELRDDWKEFRLDRCWTNGRHSLEFRGKGKPQIESIRIKIGDGRLKYKTGRVKLWKDIIVSDIVNLRSVAHTKNGDIIAELKGGDELEIIDERVVGEYVENRSEIWHEVIYQNKRGFVLSSFVEIEGQEREKIIDLIKEKCWQYDVDANVMLAIAGRESHFKLYALSFTHRQGIFQLGADAVKDMKIADPYDFYQNIDGGVRYFKWIEKQIIGRGDVLERRLVAWHDGPKYIREKRSVNYNELSEEARSFVKNVLANIEKKDWYNIISLSALILIGILSFFAGQSVIKDRIGTASIIGSPKISGFQESYSMSQVSDFPSVSWEEKENKIVFFNSNKKIVQKIDAGLLNIDKIFQTPLDFQGLSGQNLIHIYSAVLENPANVFYFLAANSFSCGVNNCTWILYRFNANENKLEVRDENILGAAMRFYPSPDSKKIAFISGVHGSICNGGDYLMIIDMLDLEEQKVRDYIGEIYNIHHIKELSWKNDQEIEFSVYYDDDCRDLKAIRKVWLYHIKEGKIKEVKSEIVNLET